jgi:hypothetical protein
VQSAARAAVRGPQDSVETMRRAYQERRDLLLQGLSGQDAVRVPVPRGAFYGFANVAAARMRRDIWALVREWLSLGVAVLPGTAFGPEYRTGCGIGLATRREDVAEAARVLRTHYGARSAAAARAGSSRSAPWPGARSAAPSTNPRSRPARAAAWCWSPSRRPGRARSSPSGAPRARRGRRRPAVRRARAHGIRAC